MSAVRIKQEIDIDIVEEPVEQTFTIKTELQSDDEQIKLQNVEKKEIVDPLMTKEIANVKLESFTEKANHAEFKETCNKDAATTFCKVPVININIVTPAPKPTKKSNKQGNNCNKSNTESVADVQSESIHGRNKKSVSKQTAQRKNKICPTINKAHVCVICKKTYKLAINLKKHMGQHKALSLKDKKTMKIIKKKIVSKPSIKKEMTKTVMNKSDETCPVKCKICDKLFPDGIKLRKHMRNHVVGKPFHCQFCGYRCSYKSWLVQHERVHTHDKPFSCDKCSYKTGKKSSLTRHMYEHIDTDKRSTANMGYQCSLCSYHTIDLRSIRRHMVVHTGEKPFECSECGNKFAEKSRLKVHMRTHTGEKPYLCRICGSCFSRQIYLTEHNMHVHTGEKPYACDICEYKTAGKYRLMRHKKTVHSTERLRPHVCKICDQSFLEKSNLNKHMYIHSGYKPFACTYCEYKALKKSCLTRHIRTHTGEKPFTCVYCERNFISKGNMDSHIKNRHLKKDDLE